MQCSGPLSADHSYTDLQFKKKKKKPPKVPCKAIDLAAVLLFFGAFVTSQAPAGWAGVQCWRGWAHGGLPAPASGFYHVCILYYVFKAPGVTPDIPDFVDLHAP